MALTQSIDACMTFAAGILAAYYGAPGEGRPKHLEWIAWQERWACPAASRRLPDRHIADTDPGKGTVICATVRRLSIAAYADAEHGLTTLAPYTFYSWRGRRR